MEVADIISVEQNPLTGHALNLSTGASVQDATSIL